MTALNVKNAGSAALDDPQALARMREIWQANVQAMAQLVRERGWELSEEPVALLGLSAPQLDALEATLGEPLPAQLRWALAWAGQWQFGWQLSEEDRPPAELGDIYGGCLQWSAALLEDYDLHKDMRDWVAHHNKQLEAQDDFDSAAHIALWQAHFPFAVMPNGDLLTIDTRNPDPQQQPVRYYFHELEGEDVYGAVLAPDFFSFVSRWTALGCAGGEWLEWQAFWRDNAHGLDLRSEGAGKWLAWLALDPKDTPAAERRPKRVRARSDADKALLLAAQAGDLDRVCKALAQGAHPDAEDLEDLLNPDMYDGFSKGETALVLAARQNRLDILQVLLDAGASLAAHELALPLLLTHTAPIDPVAHLESLQALRDCGLFSLTAHEEQEYLRLLNQTHRKQANVQTLCWLIERGTRIDPWPGDE